MGRSPGRRCLKPLWQLELTQRTSTSPMTMTADQTSATQTSATDVAGRDVGDADVAGDEGDVAFPEPLPIVKAEAPPVPDEPAPPPDVAFAATPPAAEATTTTQPESVEADLPDRPARPDPFGD